MAYVFNRKWNRKDLLKRVGDIDQLMYARPAVLDGGKADGVKAVFMSNGPLSFTVLPGRCLDVVDISCSGFPFAFLSAAGITSPAYFEEPNDGWVRSFYGGLLETCGITYSGAPCIDDGVPLGLHGRIGNAAAQDVAVRKGWKGDDYEITIEGTMSEASPFRDVNMSLRRGISTCLGSRKIIIHDVVTNKGFVPQPVMMLYHFNFGFPLVSGNSEVIGPIKKTEGRDDASRRNDGELNCLRLEEPSENYPSQVFFHTMKADKEGNTFAALVNKDRGDGKPFAVVLRYNMNQLPYFTECKIMKNGFYFLALEPGTVVPLGRKALKDRGEIVYLKGLSDYEIEIEIEMLETEKEVAGLNKSLEKFGTG